MKTKQTHYLILLLYITGLFTISGCKSGNTVDNSIEPDPPGVPPSSPSGLTADAADGIVILSWNANSEENLSHYNIFRGEVNGSLDKIAETPAGTESYTAEGLSNGITYFFAISAENSDGQTSERSEVISAIPETDVPERLEASWINQFGSPSQDGFVLLGLDYADDGTLWAISFLGDTYNEIPRGPVVAKFDAAEGSMISIASMDLPAVQILPTGIALTEDGGYLATGEIFGGSFPGESRIGTTDAFIARFDADGNRLWARQFGAEGAVLQGSDIEISDTGDVYVTGTISEGDALPGQNASGGGRDVFVVKYSLDGDAAWTRQFGNGSDRLKNHGVSIPGDEIVVTGTVADEENPLPGSDTSGNGFLRSYSTDGEILGTIQLDVPILPNEGGAMAVESSGALWVFGSSTDPFGFGNEGQRDFVLAKIDPATGKISVAAQIGTPESDWGDGIALGPDGEVYAGGSTNGSLPGFTNAGDYDIAIARFEFPQPTD